MQCCSCVWLIIAMESYKGVKVQLHAVISYVRDTIESLDSHPGLCNSKQITLVFVKKVAGLRRKNFLPLPGIEAQSLDCPTRRLITTSTELSVQHFNALLSLSFLRFFVLCLITCLVGRIHTQKSNQLTPNKCEIWLYLLMLIMHQKHKIHQTCGQLNYRRTQHLVD